MSGCVLDANVLISAALFPDSTPGKVLTLIRKQNALLISDALVRELDEVLRRPRFDRYLTLSDRERFLSAIIREARLVTVVEAIQAYRDPADDRLLELAVNGSASTLVTGDQDLLTLNPFRGIAILTPAAYLAERSP
jgi:putative PIN family toxin of toxin-antitoxin system